MPLDLPIVSPHLAEKLERAGYKTIAEVYSGSINDMIARGLDHDDATDIMIEVLDAVRLTGKKLVWSHTPAKG